MLDLVPFKHSHGMPELFRDMDLVFKRMMNEFAQYDLGTDIDVAWNPRLDLIETKDNFEVRADLPGLDRKDIDISLDRDTLVIKGEKKIEKEESDKHFHRKERHYGSFYRAMRLPGEVEAEKIDATFKDGVLRIMLPKTEETRKKIAHVKIH
jgi:HSP20 family protein